MKRSNDTDVIRELSSVRKQARNLETALTAASELKWRLHQVDDRPAVGSDRRFSAVCHAIESSQRGLRVESIYLARCAVHEQEHRMLRLCCKMRPFRREHIWSGSGVLVTPPRAVREKAVPREQVK